MTINYETLETITGIELITRTNEDGSISFIPKDEANSDYQEYLKSLEDNEE